MPISTPSIKVNAVRSYGGDVVLTGNSFDECFSAMAEFAEKHGMAIVHPFDDPLVIAGQGTTGMEIMAQNPDVDAIFIPCGGGGLLAGVGAYIKAVAPRIKVIGVEHEFSAGMTASLEAGHIKTLKEISTFADGTAVKTVGKNTFSICSKVVDEMITVSLDEICGAIKDGFSDIRVILEPAGALGIAAVKKYVNRTGATNQNLVAITTGANLDFDGLRFIAERSNTDERLIGVKGPDVPGFLSKITRILSPRSITEITFRRLSRKINDNAFLLVSLLPIDISDDLNKLFQIMRDEGFTVVELNDNAVGKLHFRYQVGEPSSIADENLFHFEFAERPGALNHLIDAFAPCWSLSTVHFRSHGGSIARVLIGMKVPEETREQLVSVINGLKNQGYNITNETDNEVYKILNSRD
eukprot:GHVL01013480.1.p1 GENE.GHVL01013480.1~~GHVL01013480.1.p1  ORF type:complete len:411 (-),score=74.83 GHVL01013480.1:273-1505(-)